MKPTLTAAWLILLRYLTGSLVAILLLDAQSHFNPQITREGIDSVYLETAVVSSLYGGTAYLVSGFILARLRGGALKQPGKWKATYRALLFVVTLLFLTGLILDIKSGQPWFSLLTALASPMYAIMALFWLPFILLVLSSPSNLIHQLPAVILGVPLTAGLLFWVWLKENAKLR